MRTTGSVSHTDERLVHEKYVMNVRPESRSAVLAGLVGNKYYHHNLGRYVGYCEFSERNSHSHNICL